MTPGTIESAEVAALPGGPVPYTLRRSPRARTLRVVLDPERGVIVTVPAATRRGWAHPEDRIEAFLADRERWLRRHLGRHAQARADLAAHGGLRDGALLRYRGDLHRLRIAAAAPTARRSSVERIGDGPEDELVVRLATRDRRTTAVVLADWLRARARTAIERDIAKHAPAMGVTPASVSVRDQRSRWGSASNQGRLSFSWRLILAPPEALDTVVVHELAHLRILGHGDRFWSIVADRRPDHVTWRHWLRDHSLELHGALEDQ